MKGKKQFIIYAVVVIFIILLIFSMVVYAKNQNQEATLEEKVTTEINYLSSRLIGILNQFNGFSFMGFDIESREQQAQEKTSKENQSDTQDTKNGDKQTTLSANNSSENNQNQILLFGGDYPTNWDTIEYQVEELYHTWNAVVIDLHALNVHSDSILKFSDILNEATIQIKKKNKRDSMEQLANLYTLLPEYANGYQSDGQWHQLLQVKSNVMSAYCFASNDVWEEAKPKIQETINLLTQKLNSVSTNNNQNQSILNKVYILAHELDNAINQKDKEIFFIQYCSMIEKMELL